MEASIAEQTVSINTVKIGKAALKKSQIEQMPYIGEHEWRTKIIGYDKDLMLFCSFPYSVLKDIVSKLNKKSDNFIRIDDSTIKNSYPYWDDNLGVILYSGLRKSFFFSVYSKDLSREWSNDQDEEISSIKNEVKIINNFLADPSENNLAGSIKEFGCDSPLSSDVFKNLIENEFNYLSNDFSLLRMKHKIRLGWGIKNSDFLNELSDKTEENKEKSKSHDYSKLIELFVSKIYPNALVESNASLIETLEKKESIIKTVKRHDDAVKSTDYISFL